MNDERTTIEFRAACHAALADVLRLRIVDELALSDRAPSELQQLLGVPSNLLAHHLNVLEHAGLVDRSRSEGDRRRSYVRLSPTGGAFAAGGRISAPARVVFVCQANSARSQLAAALWSHRSPVPAASAGTAPAPAIHREAVAVAERHGIALLSERPRALGDVAGGAGDFVISVCDNAYETIGDRSDVHWSIADPARDGSPTAFEAAYAELDRRIEALAPRMTAA